jgi:hypothetical protein
MPTDKRVYVITIAVAALLVFIGAFMPWVKVTAPFIGELTKSGVEQGDGWLTLLMAVASFGLVAWYQYGSRRERPILIALTIVGVLITIVAIADIVDVGRAAGDIERIVAIADILDVESTAGGVEREAEGLVRCSVGEGLYLTLVGGIGLAGASVAGFFRRPPEVSSIPNDSPPREGVGGPDESR